MASTSVNPYSVIADLIVGYFGYEELNNEICYPCGVDFEALAGNEKKSKAREIVEFFRRRDTVESHLLPTLEKKRPNVNWRDSLASRKPEESPDLPEHEVIRSQVPSWLAGQWHGEWLWRNGQKRVAELRITTSFFSESTLKINYQKWGVPTSVRQTIRVIETGNKILLIGIDYRFLKRGNAVGYYLDNFTLAANADKTTLKGVKVDQREIEVPVAFERIQRQKK